MESKEEMIINGIDLAGLAEEIKPEWTYPALVKGRVAHIDADFLAYQVSYEKEGDEVKSLDDMQHNAGVVVDHLKRMAGADQVHMHLTPSISNKGGRYDQALLKPYQGNRQDKAKPRYLNIMRDFLAKQWPGTQHANCEADDGMSSMQYTAIAHGDKQHSIIVTKDKDLSMVPGLHLDWSTGAITDVDGFGYVNLTDKNKLVGYGTKFFWAQMLIGDTADNTQGIPAIPGRVMNKIKPTAAITAALETQSKFKQGTAQYSKAQAVLEARAPGKCGPATAILILDKLNDDTKALMVISNIYRMYGEQIGFRNYRNNGHITWLEAFESEAKLHWMRRDKNDPDDVIKWFKELKENW